MKRWEYYSLWPVTMWLCVIMRGLLMLISHYSTGEVQPAAHVSGVPGAPHSQRVPSIALTNNLMGTEEMPMANAMSPHSNRPSHEAHDAARLLRH